MTLLEFFKKTDSAVLAAKVIFNYLSKQCPNLSIEEVADTSSGGTPNRGIIEYYNGTIAWIKSGELNDGLITSCDEFITEAGLKNSSAKVFPSGTLLMAMYGANIGKTGILNFKAATNQAVCAIFPKQGINRDFLFWYFKQKRIDFISLGKGGAQPNISQAVINNASIAIPNESTQKDIVSFLEQIQNYDSVNTSFSIPQLLEEINKINNFKKNSLKLNDSFETQVSYILKLENAILRDVFQGKLTKQNPKEENASDWLKRIKKENLASGKKVKFSKEIPSGHTPFKVPENWVWCNLGDIVHLRRGKSKHRPRNDGKLFANGTYPFIQTGDVAKAKKNSDLITTVNGYYNEFGLAQSELQKKGTLCITIAANIAECGFLSFDACVPDSIVCLIAPEKAIETYVYHYLKLAKADLERFAPATAQKNINLGILNELLIPLPPLEEINRIVDNISLHLNSVSKLKEHVINNKNASESLIKGILKESFEFKSNLEEPINHLRSLNAESDLKLDNRKLFILASEIVYQLHKEPTFGHLKLQKLIYLCQKTANMQLPTNFLRQAMGPYDPVLMRSLDAALKDNQWFEYQGNELLKYKPLSKAGGHNADFNRFFASEMKEIQFLIDNFRNLRSEVIEIVATLYACLEKIMDEQVMYSDALLWQRFYAWSEEKEKFSEKQVSRVFQRMKGIGLLPKLFKAQYNIKNNSDIS